MPEQQPRPPSGAQHEIAHGDQVAVVTEVGGTLRRYDVGGRRVLDGFEASAIADGGRGQVLAPWPNRVADGRWSWEGSRPPAPADGGAQPQRDPRAGPLGRLDARRAHPRMSVTMATTVWPTPGYPFLLEMTATYRLGDDGLTTQLRARNAGDRPAPYGVGQHPYFTAGTDLVDTTLLTVPARTRLLTDERGNPTGREAVDGSPYDFRVARPIGDLQLDTAYTDLDPGDDGRVRVRLERPDGGGVELWTGPATRWVQVFTGDTLRPTGDGSAPRSSRCPARPAPWCPATTSSCSPPARSTSWNGVSTAGDRGMDIQARHVLAFILVGSCSASNDSNARADHRLGRSCLPGPDLSGPARERAIDDPGAAPCGSRHRFLAKERQ